MRGNLTAKTTVVCYGGIEGTPPPRKTEGTSLLEHLGDVPPLENCGESPTLEIWKNFQVKNWKCQVNYLLYTLSSPPTPQNFKFYSIQGGRRDFFLWGDTRKSLHLENYIKHHWKTTVGRLSRRPQFHWLVKGITELTLSMDRWLVKVIKGNWGHIWEENI